MSKVVALILWISCVVFSFGLNTIEVIERGYRYACAWEIDQNGNLTCNKAIRWKEPVEVYVAKEFTQKQETLVKRAIKMWQSVAGIQFIYRGKLPYTSEEIYDGQTCSSTQR